MNKPIIIAICLILTLAFGFGFLWPKYQALRGWQTAIAEKEAELQSRTAYFSQIQEVSTKLAEYEESLSKISNALPSDPSLPSLFNFLQTTAAQTGLVLEDINLSGMKKGSTKEIQVYLLLDGSYSALKDFLLALEKSARLIEVKDVSFSFPSKPQEPFSFKVNIKTHSY